MSADPEPPHPQTKKRKRNPRTLGEVFGKMSDVKWCVVPGTSVNVMSDLSSVQDPKGDDNADSVIDADETLFSAFKTTMKEKQSDTIEMIKTLYPEDVAERYVKYILLNNENLPGRAKLIKTMKGLPQLAKEMHSRVEQMSQAFEDAICENRPL
tara:strand:+ start:182 stop:643 length:462 start_codon:yes stop_codon:yes gene_type:complete